MNFQAMGTTLKALFQYSADKRRFRTSRSMQAPMDLILEDQ